MADTLSRYAVERDDEDSEPGDEPGAWFRLTIILTPTTGKDAAAQCVVVRFREWRDGRYRWSTCDCPPWKAHHKKLYTLAAEQAIQDLGLDATAVPAPHALPLPPCGPPCAECGGPTRYEQAHIGGRGYCWRSRCFKGHFSRWS